jgi:hypothetical protein
VTYFIRSKVAFSMWGTYLLLNLWTVQRQMMGAEFTTDAWSDLFLGASAAFVLGFVWIGRHHWARIIQNAFGAGTDSTYRLSFWLATAGTAVMLGWLWVVGVHLWTAVLIVLFILMSHLVISRVLAETGLPTYRAAMGVSQVTRLFPISWLSARDVYFGGVFTALGPLTTREGVMPLTMHGLGACETIEPEQRNRRGLGVVVAWALLLGCLVAAAATLYCHYSYVTPAHEGGLPAGNEFGAERVPKREMAEPLQYYTQGKFKPKAHNVPLYMSIGFGATLLLQIASLRWVSWPLLPVGLVTSYGAFIETAWFSIFVGWLAKVLIVRFGGSSLFVRAKPFFVGIIFGEALAAALFLIVNAILVLSGYDIRQVTILP